MILWTTHTHLHFTNTNPSTPPPPPPPHTYTHIQQQQQKGFGVIKYHESDKASDSYLWETDTHPNIHTRAHTSARTPARTHACSHARPHAHTHDIQTLTEQSSRCTHRITRMPAVFNQNLAKYLLWNLIAPRIAKTFFFILREKFSTLKLM